MDADATLTNDEIATLGRHARDLLENVATPFIERRRAQIETLIFGALDEGKALNPEHAVQAWHALHAAVRLGTELKKTVSKGERAAQAAGRERAGRGSP